jgi:TolB-like protein
MSDTQSTTAFGRFLAELRRRHVVRFALGYAAAAFVVLQLAEIVFPAFGIGENELRILVIMVALGFPPAAVLAWVFDITTEGIKRTEGAGIDSLVPRLALLVVTVAVMSGLGVWLATVGVFSPSASIASGSGPVLLAEFNPEQPIRSIAVLPLDDFSPDGDQAYFTAGMHEELIAKLSLVEGLRVVSRTSAMQYAGTTLSAPEIGRELNVEALLEGSVTRAGDQVRITLQIIHAPSDSHIQTLQFDREVTDILALQTEIAHMVVHEIKGEHEEEVFEQVAMNTQPEAQEAYLRGRMEYDRGTPDGYRMALDYFEDAVEADPYFAPAMAGAAGSRFLVGMEDPSADSEGMEQAYSEAMKAVELDSSSFEAREVLSLIQRSLSRIPGAATVVDAPTGPKQIHVVAFPGSSDSILVDMTAYDTAWVSAMTGFGEGIEKRVRRSMPERDAASRDALEARQLMTSGRFLDATELLEGVVDEAPQLTRAWDMLVRAHVSAGDPSAAVETIHQWHESGARGAPGTDAIASLDEAVTNQGSSGYWSWTLDRLEDEEGRGRPVPRTEMAAAHAGLGNNDEAFRLLFSAIEAGEPGVLSIQSDPVFDGLRGDPRFRELAREARLLRFSPTIRGGQRGRGGR